MGAQLDGGTEVKAGFMLLSRALSTIGVLTFLFLGATRPAGRRGGPTRGRF